MDSTTTTVDIWYNKWAGGDREDNYSKCVCLILSILSLGLMIPVKQNLKPAVKLNSTRASLAPTLPATNTFVSFFPGDVVPMVGSVNICTVSLARTRLLRTLPKTASPAKSLPTIAMTWVVLAASTDRTEPSMSVVSRRRVLDQKPRKSSSDISENGVTLSGVSLIFHTLPLHAD